MFRTVLLSITRHFSLYTQQWYMSYRFVDSFRAGSGCNILILPASCQQTCMTYTIAVCTVKSSWWWTKKLSETCRVLFQNKFEKLMRLVGFIIWRFKVYFLTHTVHLPLTRQIQIIFQIHYSKCEIQICQHTGIWNVQCHLIQTCSAVDADVNKAVIKLWTKTIWNTAGRQVASATLFCTLIPTVCGLSVRNLFHVTLLTRRILKWSLDFWKNLAPIH